MFMSAYGFFNKVPNRFGSRLQVKALMWLGGINIAFGLFFKILPMATGFGPALLPLIVPELSMVQANAERSLPLQAFWMTSPFWETVLSILVQITFWVQPVLIACFLWTCGKILKEERIDEKAQSLGEMAAGVYFIWFAHLMIGIAGTTDVLLTVLKVIYILGMGFFIGFLAYFAVMLNQTRVILDKLIADTEAEEKKSGKKKKSRRLFPGRDEDEEDEEDYDD
jgi:hypothetical protein